MLKWVAGSREVNGLADMQGLKMKSQGCGRVMAELGVFVQTLVEKSTRHSNGEQLMQQNG